MIFVLHSCWLGVIWLKGQQKIKFHLMVLLCHSTPFPSSVSNSPSFSFRGRYLFPSLCSCLSQGAWREGMWPRLDQLDFLSRETASIYSGMKNRWTPLGLSVFRGRVRRGHDCQWIPDSSLELSFQQHSDSAILWNLFTLQNASNKVLICSSWKELISVASSQCALTWE